MDKLPEEAECVEGQGLKPDCSICCHPYHEHHEHCGLMACPVAQVFYRPEASHIDQGELAGACSHEEAVKAIVDCGSTVTVLSYQEAIEGYLKLRGMTHD